MIPLQFDMIFGPNALVVDRFRDEFGHENVRVHYIYPRYIRIDVSNPKRGKHTNTFLVSARHGQRTKLALEFVKRWPFVTIKRVRYGGRLVPKQVSPQEINKAIAVTKEVLGYAIK